MIEGFENVGRQESARMDAQKELEGYDDDRLRSISESSPANWETTIGPGDTPKEKLVDILGVEAYKQLARELLALRSKEGAK